MKKGMAGMGNMIVKAVIVVFFLTLIFLITFPLIKTSVQNIFGIITEEQVEQLRQEEKELREEVDALEEEVNLFQESRDLLEARKWDEAIVKSQEFIEKYPESDLFGDAHIQIIIGYNRLNRFEEATSSANKLLTEYAERLSRGERKTTKYLLGDSYFKSGEYSEAVPVFEEFLEEFDQEKTDFEVRVYLVQSYIQIRECDKAETLGNELQGAGVTLENFEASLTACRS